MWPPLKCPCMRCREVRGGPRVFGPVGGPEVKLCLHLEDQFGPASYFSQKLLRVCSRRRRLPKTSRTDIKSGAATYLSQERRCTAGSVTSAGRINPGDPLFPFEEVKIALQIE